MTKLKIKRDQQVMTSRWSQIFLIWTWFSVPIIVFVLSCERLAFMVPHFPKAMFGSDKLQKQFYDGNEILSCLVKWKVGRKL